MANRYERAFQVVLVVAACAGAVGIYHSQWVKHEVTQENRISQLQLEFDRKISAELELSRRDCTGSVPVTLQPPMGLNREPVTILMGRELAGNRYDFTVYQNGDTVELRYQYNPYYNDHRGSILATQHLPGSKFCQEKFPKSK